MSKAKKGLMALSAAGFMLIAGFEGFSGFAYEPLPGDKPTIGFGHTEGVHLGDSISLEAGVQLLRRDAQIYERAVNHYVTVPLKQCQFDALVSFTYNVGIDNFRASTLLQCVNQQNAACVNGQWMRWVYFKGEPVEGLRNRRKRELAVFNGEQVDMGDPDRVCFGSAGCISFREALQESMREPDSADYGGAESS